MTVPAKQSETFAFVGLRPLPDLVKLCWVAIDAVFRSQTTEVVHTFCEQNTFNGFAFETGLGKQLLHRRDYCDQMLRCVSVGESIVDVDEDSDTEQKTQHTFHESLERDGGITQAAGHYVVYVQLTKSQECGVCTIALVDLDL